MSDWYPRAFADRVPWHANFSVQAAANGLAHGLTAAQVAQIAVDAVMVERIVNYSAEVDGFRQAVTQYKYLILTGDLGTPPPTPPTLPEPIVVPAGMAAGIEARTRQYAAILKASVGYAPAIGEAFGIIAPAAPPAGIPALRAFALTASQVRLAVSKAGYDVLAIDSRRGGGDWEPIGISMTASFVDSRAPLVPGQPEVREYRAQGMQSNARVGALSGVESGVTVP